jgi:hypothetical protein
MPMVTFTVEELHRWVTAEELIALFKDGPRTRVRGILTAEWKSRLEVPLSEGGLRLDTAGTPIHFWWSQDRTAIVFAQ